MEDTQETRSGTEKEQRESILRQQLQAHEQRIEELCDEVEEKVLHDIDKMDLDEYDLEQLNLLRHEYWERRHLAAECRRRIEGL